MQAGISGISCFQRACTRIWTPLQKRMQPFITSVVGRGIIGSLSETFGGLFGKWIGAPIATKVCIQVVPYACPAAGAICAYRSVCQKNELMGVMALFILLLQSPLISEEERAAWYLGASEWVGEIGSVLIGGYAGLHASGSSIPFTDSFNPTHSYSTNMGKYLLIGKIFDSVIAEPQSRLGSILFSLPRSVWRYFSQFFCYQSQDILPLLRSIASGDANASIASTRQLLSMVAKRYCLDPSIQISAQITHLFQKEIGNLPSPIKTLLFASLQASVESLGNTIPDLGTAFLRGLYEYLRMLKKIRPDQSITDLVPTTNLTAQLTDVAVDQWSSSFSKTVITFIQTQERGLIGCTITGSKNIPYLKTIVQTHLKNALVHTCNHYPRLQIELTPLEKVEFLQMLTEILLGAYFNPTSCYLIGKCIGSIGILTTRVQSTFTRYVVRQEQASLVCNPRPSALDENRFSQPPPQTSVVHASVLVIRDDFFS